MHPINWGTLFRGRGVWALAGMVPQKKNRGCFRVALWLCLGCGVMANDWVAEEDDDTIIFPVAADSDEYGHPNERSGILVQNWYENNGPGNADEQGMYYQGDIMIPRARGRSGVVVESKKWQDAEVPVEIDSRFTSSDVSQIKRAMQQYHIHTCIKFVQRDSRDEHYLHITNAKTGCWSSIGRTGGRQELNLQSPACTAKIGTPMHELMHALGVFHEHTRDDRDNYVTVHWGHITKGQESNFKLAEKGTTTTFGIAYDYASLMHYSPVAFSSDGQKTITAKSGGKEAEMGQRDGFSMKDLEKINKMYNCKSKPKKDQSLTWLEKLISGGGHSAATAEP